jgi:hypothetical protein
MSATTAINIDFITQYKGSQNLKRAEHDMGLLGSATKKLGGLLAGAFAATEILAFTKNSVQAFATNQKQIAILSNTLKNFGVQGATDEVNKFITKISEASGRTREELIPAFQGLFIATGDVMGSQKELQLAMDVSAGTGKDLVAVQIALSKGYLGNTTALTRLGAGLSKSILATKDMNLINQQLAKTFSGDTAVAAETLQGKIDRLKASFHEMQVEIGAGLVDTFSKLFKSSDGVEKLQAQMHGFAVTVNDAVLAIAGLATGLGHLPYIGDGVKLFFSSLKTDIGAIVDLIHKLGDAERARLNPVTNSYGNLMGDKNKENEITKTSLALSKAQAMATAKNLAAAKAITKAAQDKLKAERDSLNLKLAGSTVDQQNIEIQAALQRGQTKEVTDVLLLQRAIINQNADQAEVLAQNVLKANGLVMDVKGNIAALGTAVDPFKDWPTMAQNALAQVALMLAQLTAKAVPINVGGGSSTSMGSTASYNPGNYLGLPDGGIISSGNSGMSQVSAASAIPGYLGIGGAGSSTVQINVSAGPGIIVDATQGSSSNGTPVTLDRLSPLGYLGIK